MIPSAYDSRIVGCICEEDAGTIVWMWLHKGEPKKCQCGYWFQLFYETPFPDKETLATIWCNTFCVAIECVRKAVIYFGNRIFRSRQSEIYFNNCNYWMRCYVIFVNKTVSWKTRNFIRRGWGKSVLSLLRKILTLKTFYEYNFKIFVSNRRYSAEG